MQLLKDLSANGSEVALERDNEYEVKEDRNRKNVSIKILTPSNDLVNKVIEQISDIGISSTIPNLKEISSSFSSQYEININSLQIRFLESQPRYNVTTVTILIVDRKASLAIEKVDDSKTEFIEAVGYPHIQQVHLLLLPTFPSFKTSGASSNYIKNLRQMKEWKENLSIWEPTS